MENLSVRLQRIAGDNEQYKMELEEKNRRLEDMEI